MISKENTFTIGGNYPLIDRSFNTLSNLLDDPLPNNNEYEQQQQRSMMMMNGTTNLPEWSMPQINFASTPILNMCSDEKFLQFLMSKDFTSRYAGDDDQYEDNRYLQERHQNIVPPSLIEQMQCITIDNDDNRLKLAAANERRQATLKGMSQAESTSTANDLYADCPWFKTRVEGPMGHLWLQAQSIFLVSKNYSKGLLWFPITSAILLKQSARYSTTTSDYQQHDSLDLASDQKEIGSEKTLGHSFNVNPSIRKLIDLIITRWNPIYLNKKSSVEKLHDSLTPSRLKRLDDVVSSLRKRYSDGITQDELKTFYSCLTTLHYHEVWASIVQDQPNIEMQIKDHEFTIRVESIEPEMTECETKETALILGTTNMISNDSFTHMNKKFSLFDVILITIETKQYFGVIVNVLALKLEDKNVKAKQQTARIELNKPIRIELSIIVAIYVSKECGDAIKQQQQKNGSAMLDLLKLSNITSPVRMISAIDNLKCWSYGCNLIISNPHDPYFHLPSDFNSSNMVQRFGFNSDQSKAIDISACMHEDRDDRLHLIFGPPGTGKSHTIAGIVLNLLENYLYKNKKILICAPSNSACDVISCHILQRLSKQQRDQHTLIRIGSQPPIDEDLSDNFLSFLVLQEIFNILQREPATKKVDLSKLQKNIINKATVIVSTLNNCASSRLSSLVGQVSFVIIDEASQSLMADSFIPNRFKCTRMILVGDPKQLRPTVISKAGQDYGLNQSLYEHLYQTLENHDRITTLKMQYRMHSKVCSFPNRTFYKKILETDPSVNERMKHIGLRHVYYYNRSIPGAIKEDDNSIKNEGEAVFVTKLCRLLIDHIGGQNLDAQKQIAVISPYRAHKCYLRSLLPPHVEVMTVEGAQGREKDFIIFSCVRSGEKIGFLNDQRRLNVALTRARKGLYIVGNLREIAQQDDIWKSLVADAAERGIIFDVKEDDLPTLPRCQSQNV
ncbi:unnamed protein product [Rotaria magnacalcarata]|uniref:Uncharacterized protein n=2 Tax=Rotaria magnacalcarata TaxID=392030 RepID=A0A8S2JYQ7_9BILA|nr:unnamed protein product [Rotaria magnacalcarata]